MIIFDSYDLKHKNPFGAARSGAPVHFVFLSDCADISHINLVMRRDKSDASVSFTLDKTGVSDGVYTFEGDTVLSEKGLYRYRFELVCQNGAIEFAGTRDGHTAVTGDWLPEWRLTVYARDFETPEGMNGAVMYQIFPDRFMRSRDTVPPTVNERIVHGDWNERPYCYYDYADYRCNDYFMGDLQGIEQKLGYLSSLGVTHLYLNPIFESTENHRYSTSDYMRIDPYLGDTDAFVSLCEKARGYDIKIILDGVFSHTGDDSLYFNRYGHYGNGGAYNDSSSPYYDWYKFINYPDEYECWWGFKTLPNVNETNEDYTEFITGEDGVLRHWMKKGAYGWRLDVADELPDEFLENIRRAVKSENPDSLIIGEVWENAVTKRSYGKQREFLLGCQCDTVMNYPFLNAVTDFVTRGDSEAFYGTVMQILDDYPAPAVNCLMNILSTHDTSRILNRLGAGQIPERRLQAEAKLTDNERVVAVARLMTAAAIQYTLPGIPCVFYGDEVGIEGFGDPFCRATFPWGHENEHILKLHRELGIIRKEYRDDFGKPIRFYRYDGGIVSYRRGRISVTVNMSGKDMPVCNGSLLCGRGLANGIIGNGGFAVTLVRDVN